MDTLHALYQDIARRTAGDIYIGVVGPARTGKSTFIQRFMETLVLPNIPAGARRDRARDELPQSGSGRTVMTAEPKFVPEEAARVELEGGGVCSLRLVDCVGYLVPGAEGQMEDDLPRMVRTPWFPQEIPMAEAAEIGTRKVITEHATIGVVVTSDGSVTDLPREAYVEAEARVVGELKALGKPFLVLLNSAHPRSPETQALRGELAETYDVTCLAVSCPELDRREITDLLSSVLYEFPVEELDLFLPPWVDALAPDHGKRVPFAAGTSVCYNYIDLRVRNDTDRPFQLRLWCADEQLHGAILGTRREDVTYDLLEEGHHFAKEGEDYYRISKIYRLTLDRATGQVLDKTLIRDNHSLVMFDPALLP